MSIGSCTRAAKEWLDKNSDVKLSARELADVGTLLSKAEELGASPEQKNKLMAQLVDQKIAVDQAHRQASNYLDAINIEKGKSATMGMRAAWVDKGVDGQKASVEAFLARIRGGSSSSGVGSNLDPLHMEESLKTQYHQTLQQQLGPQDFPIFQTMEKNSPLSKAIYEELGAMRQGTPLGQTGNDMALRMAKGIRASQDIVLKDIQSVNPFFGESGEMLFPRTHNRDLIMADPTAAGKEAWVQQAMKNFSPSFFGMEPAARKAAFESIYEDIKNGTHDGGSFDPQSFWKKPLPGGNQAKAMSAARTLVAASPTDEWEYACKYGENPYLAQSRDFDYKGREVAKLQKWGPNAANNFESEYNAILKSLPKEEQENFRQNYQQFRDAMEVTMGRQQNVAYGWKARLTQTALGIENLIQIGAHVPRALNGIQTGLTLMRDGSGRTFFQNAYELAQHLGGGLLSMDGGKEGAQMLGVNLRSVARELSGDLAAGADKPGMISKLGEAAGKVSLADRYTSAMKFGVAKMHAEWLGSQAHLSFDQLPKETQNLLTRYGLNGERWNAARMGVSVDGPTKGMLTPERMRNVDDDAIKKVLQKEGGTLTNSREYDRVRLENATRLGTLYNDVAGLSAGETNTRSRLAAYGNTSINDGIGMARRLMMQFKQHAFVQQQVLMRTIQSGADGGSNISGVAQHVMGAMFLSAVGEGIVALGAGKTLQSPFSKEMIGHAVLSSGGLGMYGDSIAHAVEQKQPTDQKLMMASSLLGPSFGTASKVGVAAYKTAQGIGGAFAGKEMPGQYGGKYWAQVIQELTPQHNLFYAKGAIDGVFLNEVHKFMGGDGYMESLKNHIHDTPGWPEALGGTGDKQRFTYGDQNVWR